MNAASPSVGALRARFGDAIERHAVSCGDTIVYVSRERAHEVLVRARYQRVHQLDHRDLRAERVVHRRHLEPDDAAADDQQALRHPAELERAGRIDDARIGGNER